MKLVKHKLYPEMYYLKWPDGVLSVDFYSKTWAKDHIARITSSEARQRPLEARGEV